MKHLEPGVHSFPGSNPFNGRSGHPWFEGKATLLPPTGRGSCRQTSDIVDLRNLVSDLDLGCGFRDHVAFCTDFPVAACPIRVDSAAMEAVVRELVLRAREAVGRHGTVLVGIERLMARKVEGNPTQGWVRLEVADSGRSSKSRGLGLSTAFGLVRESGGRMEISSVPASGTVVRVWLPSPLSQPQLYLHRSDPV